MKLISSKKKLKGNSSLTYVLYACLASASCEGMEEKEPSSVPGKQHGYFKDVTSDSNDSGDSGEIEDYAAGSSNTGLSYSNLYQCSESEIFSLEQIIQEVKGSQQKVNRRIDEDQLNRLLELRKFDFSFEEALSQVKKEAKKGAEISSKEAF